MADRFPLILNTSANQIQEIGSGDTLDLTGSNIKGVGIITATNLSGNIIAGAGASNIVSGILTTVAADIDDFVDVGSNIQLGNAGVITATTFKGDGDFVELDVDGHTNLDNVSVGGATTMSGNLRIQNAAPHIYLTDTDGDDYSINVNGGNFEVRSINANSSRLQILSGGTVRSFGNFIAAKDLDVDGHTNLDNVSIAGVATVTGNLNVGGVLTYEDVTNVDSVGLITARNGINVSGGNVAIAKDIDVDGHTNLDNVSIAGVTTFAGSSTINNILYVKGAENTDGILAIYADEGDDNNDMWRLRAGTNSAFYIDNYANGAWQTNLAATATSTSLYSAGYVKVNTTTNGINVYNGESGGTTTINVTKGSGDAEVACQRTGGSGIKLRGSHPSSFLETTNDTNLNIRRNTSTRIALNSNGNTIYENTTFQNGITGTTASFSSAITASTYIQGTSSNGGLKFYSDSSASKGVVLDTNDHLVPTHDSNSDLGLTGTRWRNLYADTLYGNGNNLTQIVTAGSNYNSNLDTANTVAGVYRVNTGISNGHSGMTNYGTLFHANNAQDTGFQMYVNYNDGRAFLRGGNTTTFNGNSPGGGYANTTWAEIAQSTRDFIPETNNTINLGSTSKRFANIYTNDLNLSNEGGGNDVDGTWGNFTIQEGESDLYLINNRNGKKYKFNLTEVS